MIVAVASATNNVCNPAIETCSYKPPTQKKNFFSRLAYKFWGGVSSGTKSITDLGYGTARTAETAASGTAAAAGHAYGVITKVTKATASTLSKAASDTVNGISDVITSSANAIDEWVTSTCHSDVKKTLARDCKRELVHNLLGLYRVDVDKHPNWGKRDSEFGFCRSIIEKAFEKAKDEDPSKEVCQFYDHVKETYMEECALRGIPQSTCTEFADHTAKILLEEKEQNCAEGYVTIIRC